MHIYIEDNEKIALPKKYRPVNNICAIIYDQLTEIYKGANYRDFLGGEIKLDPKTQKLVKELRSNKIHIFDWLKENHLNDELTSLLTKHLTLAITSDFVNFIFESLSNAKRGKMTVAYSLLRKPFMDELLILEQLLFDPNEFMQRFFHAGDPDTYDPSNPKIDKKTIIKQALSKMNSRTFFSEELIYDLRYNKSSPSGLNGMANHALHIVTRDKNYKTERQNLNFVFSDKDDIVEYWNNYYSFVPYLLIYSVSIVDSIIFNYLPDQDNQNIKAVKSLRRIVGMLLFSEKTKRGGGKERGKIYKAITSSIKLHCKKCKCPVKLTKADLELFFETEDFYCPKCLQNLLTSRESVQSIKTLIDTLN